MRQLGWLASSQLSAGHAASEARGTYSTRHQQALTTWLLAKRTAPADRPECRKLGGLNSVSVSRLTRPNGGGEAGMDNVGCIATGQLSTQLGPRIA